MPYVVFYSWQTDARANANRSLIRQALDEAAQRLGSAGVEDPPRVDSGMEGVAGSPEVASVMFEKIADSAVFVGDLTLVGSIMSADHAAKQAPNPNVSLEMGYAAGTLGWGRVIAVMNEHYGSAFDQPFDVRNRRFPIRYNLDPDDSESRAGVLERLTDHLYAALKACADAELRTAWQVVSRLDTGCRSFIRQYADSELIPEPPPNSFSLGSASGLDTPRLLAAVARLLDLGVVESVYDASLSTYGYSWTHLGRQVILLLA